MSKSPAADKQMAAKMEEAEKQMKEGDKLASKTLTRWKPDWDGASVFYEKAATNYKNAKAYEQAKQAFKKASNAQYQNNLYYTAAKHLETAATMAKEQKLLDEAAELHEKASLIYRENGSGFNAAENLAKAAKILETTNIEKAMEYLKLACELFELEDKEHYSGETFKIAINLFLRHKKYADTVELLNNQSRVFKKLNQTHDLHKCYLSQIVIYLYCDDLVAANKLYTGFLEIPGFSSSQEGMAASELLDAYESRNPDALKSCINKQLFNFLDNQVTKIARSMTISDSLVPQNQIGTAAPSATTTTTTTATSSSSSSIAPPPTAPPAYEDEDSLV